MNKELKIVKSLDSNEAYEIINNIIGIVICETNPDIKTKNMLYDAGIVLYEGVKEKYVKELLKKINN